MNITSFFASLFVLIASWFGHPTASTYHYVMTQDFPYSVSCFHGKSYEPKPGQNGGGSSSTGNMSGMDMQSSNQSGTPPTPPAAALGACSGSSSGSMCSFSTPHGTISGTCQTPPQQTSLACVPQ